MHLRGGFRELWGPDNCVVKTIQHCWLQKSLSTCSKPVLQHFSSSKIPFTFDHEDPFFDPGLCPCVDHWKPKKKQREEEICSDSCRQLLHHSWSHWGRTGNGETDSMVSFPITNDRSSPLVELFVFVEANKWLKKQQNHHSFLYYCKPGPESSWPTTISHP